MTFEDLLDPNFVLLSTTAMFDRTTGTLVIVGDATDNSMEISTNPGDKIFVRDDDRMVRIVGGRPDVDNVELIQVYGQSGNDILVLDDANGALPDTQFFGGAGNDHMVVSARSATDVMEGGDGIDTAEVNGGSGAEIFTVTANGARVRLDRLDPSPYALDIGTTEHLVVNLGGGDDQFSATGNLAALIQITVDGGEGNDTILGSNGADVLLGGAGNDVIDGQQGSDVAFLGEGDDVFQWDPGDGSDTVEGGAGFDNLRFNGSNGAEIFQASANGGRVLFTRNLGNIVMDLDGIERLELNALGNTDTVIVNDLSGTDLTEVNVNLAGTLGGNAGDASADTVIANGSSGNDAIEMASSGASAGVTGIGAALSVSNAEAMDQVIARGLEGNDTISAAGSQAGATVTLVLDGGAGDDTLITGAGSEILLGGADNDRMVANDGNGGTDVMEGGDGIDTAEVNGGSGAEIFTVTANGARVRLDRLDPSPYALDIGTTEHLVVNLGGGDDQFSATGNLAALIQITVDGGEGNDTILGSNGADVLLGGAGNDFIDGQQGSDVAFLGEGDDVFQWDPGDGSDTVEGEAGFDNLRFNGSNADEIINVSANGERALLTRNLGNIAMDLNEVERIEVNIAGGTDTVVVNDLSGSTVQEVKVGFSADAQVDTVIAAGTGGDDFVEVFGGEVPGGGTLGAIGGLPAFILLHDIEAVDQVVINTLGGDDTINAAGVPAGIMKLVLDGGAGNDTLLGSQGADVFLGGEGNDFIFGDNGNDLALMGAGDDLFQWDPGDGSDTIEGQAGSDKLLFFGSNVAENIDIFANGGRVIFFRDVANVTMDLDDVETIEYQALGGADRIVVGDLSGTDVAQVDLDLAGPAGEQDQVTVNGTNGDDVISVARIGEVVRVGGLTAQVDLAHAEATDRLVVNGLGGDDLIDASDLPAGHITLVINGGLGDDAVLGSAGDDLVNGGDGDDLALLGDGDDIFVWNPGDDNDILEGQAGFDTLLFNGANVGENIAISANGGRAMFFRDVASVTMDLDDVEAISFNALGGADTIVVNDLSGTAVVEVNLNLAAANGAGDAQPDTVVVHATAGDDVIVVTGDAGGFSVLGLAAQVNVTGAEAGLDQLIIYGGAGDDIFVNARSVGDFQAGAGSEDKLDLTAIAGLTFEWLQNHAAMDGANAVLDLGNGQQVTLLGVQVSSLHADDFLLA